MRTIVLRTIPAVLLLLAGVAALVYGAKCHTVIVTEQREITVKTGPPEFFPPQPTGAPSFEGMPPPFVSTAKQKVVIAEDASEPTVINEITFGGVTLLADGRIQRTYTGKPPSLCPT